MQLYKQKLRELKRASRSLLKRLVEAKSRPAAVATLKEVLNMSEFFLQQMKNFSNNSNLSKEIEQVFTEVEIKTLETLSNETRVCMLYCGKYTTYICTYVFVYSTVRDDSKLL